MASLQTEQNVPAESIFHIKQSLLLVSTLSAISLSWRSFGLRFKIESMLDHKYIYWVKVYSSTSGTRSGITDQIDHTAVTPDAIWRQWSDCATSCFNLLLLQLVYTLPMCVKNPCMHAGCWCWICLDQITTSKRASTVFIIVFLL